MNEFQLLNNYSLCLQSDEYNPEEDDLDYGDLIFAGEVADETGKVFIRHFSPEEIDSILRMSPVSIQYVISGRGDFRSWKSNLQKMVRRGKLDEALKSLQEIADMGGVFLSNVINRLCKVMVSEDISIGEPWIAKDCYEFLTYYESVKRIPDVIEEEDFRHRLSLITKKLVLARKSRLPCLALSYLNRTRKAAYEKEKILQEDKSWAELFQDFKDNMEGDGDFEEGAWILLKLNWEDSVMKKGDGLGGLEEKEKKFFSRKRKMIYKVWLYIMRQSAINDDLWEINSYLLGIYSIGGGEIILNLMNAYMNLTLYLDGLLDLRKPSLLELKDTVAWEKIQSWDHIWIDSVSYDKHTDVGKDLGRDMFFFYRYGGKVANKKKEFDELERKMYNKLCEIGLKKEREEREQL
jgi:hypothetical protein